MVNPSSRDTGDVSPTAVCRPPGTIGASPVRTFVAADKPDVRTGLVAHEGGGGRPVGPGLLGFRAGLLEIERAGHPSFSPLVPRNSLGSLVFL